MPNGLLLHIAQATCVLHRAHPQLCDNANFLRLWREVAQGAFPFMREELGELDETARLFVVICGAVVVPEAFDYAKRKCTRDVVYYTPVLLPTRSSHP